MNISLLEVLTVLQALATLGLIGVAVVLWIRVDELKRLEMLLVSRADLIEKVARDQTERIDEIKRIEEVLVAHSARMDVIRKDQSERLTEHEQRMALLIKWEADPTYAAQVAALNKQIDEALKNGSA